MGDHEPKRGQEFTHLSFRRQLPDGTNALAVMKVTAVRRGEVFYTYADSPTNKGDWRMPIDIRNCRQLFRIGSLAAVRGHPSPGMSCRQSLVLLKIAVVLVDAHYVRKAEIK